MHCRTLLTEGRLKVLAALAPPAGGALTVRDLSDRTSLTRQAIYVALRPLLDEGIVAPVDGTSSYEVVRARVHLEHTVQVRPGQVDVVVLLDCGAYRP